MAHPDDIEITCAGTLALLRESGWEVHMATLTDGDMGSMTLPREEIAKVRRKEAESSAKVIGAAYSCLGLNDLTLVYGEATKRNVTGLLRLVRPDMLITHPPEDYMADHEETARIARESAFASTIPNWKVEGSSNLMIPCEALPVLLYTDPIENIDRRGERVAADRVVDITGVFSTKEKMLACHASQRDWLRSQHGEDEYLGSMRRWAEDRARDFDDPAIRQAEGFTRHLGHAFPRGDLLVEALGAERVKSIR